MMKDKQNKNRHADEDVAKTEQTMKKSYTSANNLIHHCESRRCIAHSHTWLIVWEGARYTSTGRVYFEFSSSVIRVCTRSERPDLTGLAAAANIFLSSEQEADKQQPAAKISEGREKCWTKKKKR